RHGKRPDESPTGHGDSAKISNHNHNNLKRRPKVGTLVARSKPFRKRWGDMPTVRCSVPRKGKAHLTRYYRPYFLIESCPMLLHPLFDPVAFQNGQVAVHWYGLMHLGGFTLVWLLGRWRINRG